MPLLDAAAFDSLLVFADRLGLELFPWQKDAFGAACAREGGHFKYRLAGISVARGQGKSFAASLVGLWRLLCGEPPQDVISGALDYDGARVVLDHAKRSVRGHPALGRTVEVRADGLAVPSTGSRWTITSREHLSSRGRHATVLLLDEQGWARDSEQFASLLAGQASVP